MGLEQELFLVDESRTPSSLADDFLARCGELAVYEGLDPGNFNPECARNLVEVSTPPAHSVEELARSYLAHLRIVLSAGRDLGASSG